MDMISKRKLLQLPHGDLEMPAFLPDATFGVVRSADSFDLEQCGVQAIMMNSFHLSQRPGSTTVKALSGLNKMSGWNGPIFTDSGGFQAYSLIRENSKFGSISDNGIIFRPEGSRNKFNLTPEKSIQLQLSFGADVIFCLDVCTHVDDSLEVQKLSVKRTIDWAIRCKNEFQKIIHQKNIPQEHHPLLFAVIQGGGSSELRKQCANELLNIGFDGFGYGGWPLDNNGNLLHEIIKYTRQLVPLEFPMHALGIGHPINIVECFILGYGLFDSAMPTRDARHGRLYVVDTKNLDLFGKSSTEWFSYIYINDKKYIKADRPISDFCDCLCCSRYSLGYLRHLFDIKDVLFQRLATTHNLRMMMKLLEHLRKFTSVSE